MPRGRSSQRGESKLYGHTSRAMHALVMEAGHALPALSARTAAPARWRPTAGRGRRRMKGELLAGPRCGFKRLELGTSPPAADAAGGGEGLGYNAPPSFRRAVSCSMYASAVETNSPPR